MRRSTFAVVLLAGMVLAACAKRSSLYLDSGRSESSPPPHAEGPAGDGRRTGEASSHQRAR